MKNIVFLLLLAVATLMSCNRHPQYTTSTYTTMSLMPTVGGKRVLPEAIYYKIPQRGMDEYLEWGRPLYAEKLDSANFVGSFDGTTKISMVDTIEHIYRPIRVQLSDESHKFIYCPDIVFRDILELSRSNDVCVTGLPLQKQGQNVYYWFYSDHQLSEYSAYCPEYAKIYFK